MGTLFSDFFSLFYPNVCCGCENVLPKGCDYICPKCRFDFPKTNTHKLEVPQFREKFQGIVPVSDILIYTYFHKGGLMQVLLRELKYGGVHELGQLLGRLYGRDLAAAGFSNSLDILVPVPIHSKRRKERGYNQSEEFAKGLSDALNVPVCSGALGKVKNIDSQTRKSKVSRAKNVGGVFEVIDTSVVKNKRILLVDDVLTTGSTLVECIDTLLPFQPKSVSIATISGVK